MKENRILEKYSAHRGFAPDAIQRALHQISVETGFVPVEEQQRRYLFDPDKTWRVAFSGAWQRKSVTLVIENMPHETDEEEIRRTFREQAQSSGVRNVRPPFTYIHRPFDAERGYGWILEESKSDRLLFAPDRESPDLASQSFAHFYRALRHAITEPFWPCEHTDAAAFSRTQLDGWTTLSQERHLDHASRVMSVVERLAEPYLAAMAHRPLHFMHGHLSGWDVRIGPAGEYVVYANLYWKWRQPGYDVAFPLWGQWLALPDDERTSDAVRVITETWLTMVHHNLAGLVNVEDVSLMVMNRLIGALLLDVQAQRGNRPDESVNALEAALIAEAARILS